MNSIDIIKSYFSNIIYVDDDFSVNFSGVESGNYNYVQHSEDVDPTSTEFDATSFDLDISNEMATTFELEEKDIREQNNQEIFGNINELIRYSIENQLNIFPYRFCEQYKVEEVATFLNSGNLIVLDWELEEGDEGEKSLEIINELKKQKSLKFIIIYTNTDLVKVYDILTDSNSGDIDFQKDSEALIKLNNLFIKVVSKDRMNVGQINLLEVIKDFCESLFNEYGTTFVLFFDVINKLKEQTGIVIKDFMNPMDMFLALQCKSSGIDEIDYTMQIKNIILNYLTSTMEVTSNLIDDLIKKCTVEAKLNIQSLTKDKIFRILFNYRFLVESNTDKLQIIRDKIVESELINILSYFESEYDYTKYNKDNTKKFKAKISELAPNSKLKDPERKYLAKYMPLIYLALLHKDSTNLNEITNKFVQLIKFNPYQDNYKSKIEKLKEDEKYAINLFKQGDILVNRDATEFMLCISTPCDALRPSKTDYILKFLTGKPINKEVPNEVKLSKHYTLIPIGERIYNVEWKFHEDRNIKLNDEHDIKILLEYERPYNMYQQYIKQIISRYISFWNRSGVDEIFMKLKEDEFILGKQIFNLVQNL